MSLPSARQLPKLAILVVIVLALIYCVRALQDWFEYDFDFPAQDCLMNTWTIQGTVKDEQNKPIENAEVQIRGRELSCDKAVRFPAGRTDITGTFYIVETIYSPVVKDWRGPTIEPTERAWLLKLRGVYEVTVSADGYIPYYKADMTDEIFGGLNIVLKRR
jgi:hypothetical protein